MKTIGVLGGVGPHATMDFEQRVHREAQRHLPPRFNTGYPPMVVWYHRSQPFVMSEPFKPAIPYQVDPDLAQGARWLGQVADFLAITANSIHLVKGQIEQAAGKPVLSMIEATLDEVRSRRWKRTGVMGFGDPSIPVYTVPMHQLGMPFEVLSAELQAGILQAVPRLMEGTETAANRQAVRDGVEDLRRRGVDGIILGCTELAFLLGEGADAPDLLNPAQVLAEAAVREAIS